MKNSKTQTGIETEVKVFTNNIGNFEEKIKEKWELIFSWQITDFRYDAEKSEYDLIRKRRTIDSSWEQKTLLTTKIRTENQHSSEEYEEELTDKQIDDFLEQSNISKEYIKKYTKNRNEYKVYLSDFTQKEEHKNIFLKIAFDEYIKNPSDKDPKKEDYSLIKKFAEIETEGDIENIKLFLEKVDLWKATITTLWPKKLKLHIEKKLEIKEKIQEGKEWILDIILQKQIETDLEKPVLHPETQKIISQTNALSKIILTNLRNWIMKNKDIFDDYLNDKEDNINSKYIKKINRNFSALEKWFLSFLYDYLNTSDEKDIDIKELTRIYLDVFLKIIFMFWSNIGVEELKFFLWKKYFINKNYKSLKNKLDLISNNDISSFSLKKKIRYLYLYEMKKIYKNTWNANINYDLEEKFHDIIEKNIISDLEYLSKKFSSWLNSPHTDKKFFIIIKNNLLDLKKSIKILKEKNIAFKDCVNFNELFTHKNDIYFLQDVEWWIEKEKELLEKFLHNIDENDNDFNKIIEEIQEQYSNFNKENIDKIILKRYKYWNKEININEIEEKYKDINIDNINYELWKAIPYQIRLYIFYNNIIKKQENFDLVFKDIKEKNEENIELFTQIEYSKINKNISIDKIDKNSKSYLSYKKSLEKQLIEAYTIFNNKENILWNIEKHINDVNLLVTFFRFLLKLKQHKESWDKIENLNISSNNFTEWVLCSLKRKWFNDFEKLIFTSNAQNFISTNNLRRKNKLVIEKMDIQKFNFDIFLNIDELFLPIWIEEPTKKDILDYNKEWLQVVSDMLKSKKIDKNNPYYNVLHKYGITDNTELSNLKTFLKLCKTSITELGKIEEETNKIQEVIMTKISPTELKNIWIKEADLKYPLWTKNTKRTIQKTINKYSWNLENLSDINRFTIKSDSFNWLLQNATNLIKYLFTLKEVDKIFIEDNIWNLFEKSKKIADIEI